jgi:hypothetical protein
MDGDNPKEPTLGLLAIAVFGALMAALTALYF